MIPDEALTSILHSIPATGTTRCRLVKNNPSAADKDVTLAGLAADEADFPGYPSGGEYPTWGSPSIVSPDDGKIVSSTIHFQPSGMSTPQIIYGYFVTFVSYGVGNALWMWKRFPTPLVLASDASTIDLVISVYDKDFSPP